MRGSYNSDPYCAKRVRVLVIQPALLPSRRGSDGGEPCHREAMLGLTDLIPSLPRCRLASPVNPARRQDGAGFTCYTRAASIHSGSATSEPRYSVKAMKVAHAGARLAVAVLIVAVQNLLMVPPDAQNVLPDAAPAPAPPPAEAPRVPPKNSKPPATVAEARKQRLACAGKPDYFPMPLTTRTDRQKPPKSPTTTQTTPGPFPNPIACG